MFRNTNKKFYSFPIKGVGIGKIELIKKPLDINAKDSSHILVESFIGEYQEYLSPEEISEELTSWRKGEKSVETYYKDYFITEMNDFIGEHKNVGGQFEKIYAAFRSSRVCKFLCVNGHSVI